MALPMVAQVFSSLNLALFLIDFGKYCLARSIKSNASLHASNNSGAAAINRALAICSSIGWLLTLLVEHISGPLSVITNAPTENYVSN